MSNYNNQFTTTDNTQKVKIHDIAGVQKRNTGRQRAIELLEVRLTQGLQRSLEISTLLEFFCKEIAEIVPCDSVAYQNSKHRVAHAHGKVNAHICTYQLDLEGEHLGELICTRAKPFGDLDLLTIESLAATLVYPLRNALMYQQAVSMALQDPLTGVGNRKALEQAITRETKLVERHHTPFSMLMIDIDFFKKINDTHGHAAGDQAIIQVTEMISHVVRESDQLYRYGGEEFVVLLNNTDIENAHDLAERIRHAIEATEICYNNKCFDVTVSIGIADFHQNEHISQLFSKADAALYQAKESGRNQVKVAA